MTLSGRCPPEVAKTFFGGRLISLDKKSGGIRPIAIGFTLRRLTSKIANNFGVSRLASYFCPRQLGVGTPGGCEAAIHAARRYLEALQDDHVMVKLDFTNAFNSLHRLDMLRATRERLPELYPYVFSSYSKPSDLHHGSFTLSSCEGPQQGDPIGPLLFSNTIHPLLASLHSELTIGYLDDVTLAGPQSTVADDVLRIRDAGRALGLSLNVSKCELIGHRSTQVSHALLQSFRRLNVDEASLLGAPLFQGTSLDLCWEKCCEDLSRATDRLKSICSQDALILLRASFGAPRVQHLLRSAPSYDHIGLSKFDDIQMKALALITNSNLTHIQWLQASLPIKDGGLGLRRVTSLVLPAFLASTSSSRSLQDALLATCPCPPDSFSSLCLNKWLSEFGTAPLGSQEFKQSVWDRPGINADKNIIWSSLQTQREKAIFLAATASHSGAWLSALPIASCGLRLDDEAVRVGVALRLGLQICSAHECRCGTSVDCWGQHAMICKKAPARMTRHHAVNDIIARAFTSAGVPVSKEPLGIFRNDGKRPDGLTLVPWRGGKALTWDATIVTTLAESYLNGSSTSAGSASEAAALRKLDKYADLPADLLFQPIALESLGPVSSSTSDFIAEIGRRITLISGDPREESFLRQRISVCLQRFNSVLLHQSFVDLQEEPGV